MNRFMFWLVTRQIRGTGRWAIRCAHGNRLLSSNPREAFEEMLVNRYRLLPKPLAQKFLAAEVPTIEGLFGLVVAVVRIETAVAAPDSTGWIENSFSSCTSEQIASAVTTIADTLERANLAPELVFGRQMDYFQYAKKLAAGPVVAV